MTATVKDIFVEGSDARITCCLAAEIKAQILLLKLQKIKGQNGGQLTAP